MTGRHEFQTGAVSPHRAQRGLTLVEMLVSVSLGLLLLGAALYVYYGSKGSYRISKSTSRLQEAGHFGLEAMLRDVRATGFIGCGSYQQVTATTSVAPQIYQIANPPLTIPSAALALRGYPPNNYNAQGATSGWTSQPPGINAPWLAGDVLTLHVGMGSPIMMAATPPIQPTSFYITNNCSNLAAGNYLMVSNCTSATIMRISKITVPGGQNCPASHIVTGGVEVEHTAALSPGPNPQQSNVNPTSWYGQPIPANWPLQLYPPMGYKITAQSMPQVQQFDEVTYYVGQLPGNVRPPALYRYSAAAGVAEEIIDHIENLVVLYGVSQNGAVTCQTAQQVETNNTWPSVVSVRATLVAVGDEKGAVDLPQSFSLGTCDPNTPTPITIPAVPGDTRLREIFTATAALRDRLP